MSTLQRLCDLRVVAYTSNFEVTDVRVTVEGMSAACDAAQRDFV